MNELKPIEHSGQRVITTELLAEVYKTEPNNIKNNFKNHKENFKEGVHYFLLQGEELRQFKSLVNGIDLPIEISKFAPQLYLWTERGANRHCKILDTPKAWEQFDNLEETYFAVKDKQMMVLPKDYPAALRALADETEKNLALSAENEAQRQVIADYEPKVQYVDKILRSKGTLAVSQIAADYDMSARRLNKILHEAHVQHCVNGQWILYREHMGMGYTRSVPIEITRTGGQPDTVSQTQWTQKGRLFIHEILKKRGIMAVIDRKLAGEQMEIETLT